MRSELTRGRSAPEGAGAPGVRSRPGRAHGPGDRHRLDRLGPDRGEAPQEASRNESLFVGSRNVHRPIRNKHHRRRKRGFGTCRNPLRQGGKGGWIGIRLRSDSVPGFRSLLGDPGGSTFHCRRLPDWLQRVLGGVPEEGRQVGRRADVEAPQAPAGGMPADVGLAAGEPQVGRRGLRAQPGYVDQRRALDGSAARKAGVCGARPIGRHQAKPGGARCVDGQKGEGGC